MSDCGMTLQEVGMSTRYVSRGRGFLRASSTSGTNIAFEPVASPTKLPDKEVEENQIISDTSDDEWEAGESDEISESQSNSENDVSEEELEKEDDSNDDQSECQSEEGDNVGDGEGGVDQNVTFRVGQEFKNVYHFREVLEDYEVQEGFKALRHKNDKSRVTAICAGNGCAWRIHASVLPSDHITFVVKTLVDKHTCRGEVSNLNVTSKWIAKKLASNFRADPAMSNKVMENMLKEKYNVDTTNMRLYRARWRARDEIDGSHAKSFNKLESYGDMIKAKNPGNSYVIQYQNGNKYGEEDAYGVVRVNPQFKHMYICFDACIQGFFKGCRPFIGLDGCHLKGLYGGVLVSAISVDGNNGIFPVAYGVVESEGNDSWLFFLHHLHESIDRCIEKVYNGRPTLHDILTFMTDKQKDLIEAISTIFPEANHRHCSRHLYNNFKKVFGGGPVLRGYFWAASKAYNVFEFQRAMGGMKAEKNEAYVWDKPILTLIDVVRYKLMGRLQKRFSKGCNFEEEHITPRMKKKLDDLQRGVRYCRATFAGGDKYEVQDNSGTYVVDMANNFCECGIYIATGLPCKHVGACIQYKRVPLQQFCDSYYSKQRYILAHEGMIDPMSDLSTLADRSLLPPPMKRSIGRPNKSRRREQDEARKEDIRKRSSTLRCSKCKSFDHNRRTCKGGPVAEKRKSTSKNKGSSQQRTPKKGTSSSQPSSTQQRSPQMFSCCLGAVHGADNLLCWRCSVLELKVGGVEVELQC
ncbi:uncharacterized protein LOC122638616 [Telopea speciosissima]|uniref:uncharacterized protein LOC122638616 n=1 Tax=Telopea speciosissima TaxID=54955 RepID=UPI001CC5C86F|nr:uncharacterized protein LOC122638616 [Telopea speciosissima]